MSNFQTSYDKSFGDQTRSDSSHRSQLNLNTEQRREHDFIGEKDLPKGAMYGIQTARAKDNFDLSGKKLSEFPQFIRALAIVKKSCAMANEKLNNIDTDVARSILNACTKIENGEFDKEFILDMIQGGAGTSTNMNINEVIANIVAVNNKLEPGNYQYCNPNNHVNRSQSTNDVYPTAIRLALLFEQNKFTSAFDALELSLRNKATVFSDVLKTGRTQLQDAVPMTLGQEFAAFADFIGAEKQKISSCFEALRTINLGGTAIGTGINAPAGFSVTVAEQLSTLTKLEIVTANNLMAASYDVGALINLSSAFKNFAIKLSKIANDLRLLSMGPRAGIAEIQLPPMQPGSSIMPGKINPVIPEAVSQVAFQIVGFDHANTFAAEAGQLQLNAMEPLIALNLFQTLDLLTRTMIMFRQLCIDKLSANQQNCEKRVNNSIGLVTALTPYIGYENCCRIAKQALAENRSVLELVVTENLLSKQHLNSILDPKNML